MFKCRDDAIPKFICCRSFLSQANVKGHGLMMGGMVIVPVSFKEQLIGDSSRLPLASGDLQTKLPASPLLWLTLL